MQGCTACTWRYLSFCRGAGNEEAGETGEVRKRLEKRRREDGGDAEGDDDDADATTYAMGSNPVAIRPTEREKGNSRLPLRFAISVCTARLVRAKAAVVVDIVVVANVKRHGIVVAA